MTRLFGTNGIRGVVGQDMTAELAVRVGRAIGTHFGSGSMAPKIQAVVSYLEHDGREAIITSPSNIEGALAGRTGTRITPG